MIKFAIFVKAEKDRSDCRKYVSTTKHAEHPLEVKLPRPFAFDIHFGQ